MTFETESSGETPGEHLAQRNQLVQQGKVTGCVNFKGPSQGLGPALGLGLGAPAGPGPTQTRAPRGWGPGPQSGWGLDPKLFVVLKSLLVGGWQRGGSQLNNYDGTRSDHGPVGNTWLCYILVTIDYATYL